LLKKHSAQRDAHEQRSSKNDHLVPRTYPSVSASPKKSPSTTGYGKQVVVLVIPVHFRKTFIFIR